MRLLLDDKTTFGLRILVAECFGFLCFLTVDSCSLFTATSVFYRLELFLVQV